MWRQIDQKNGAEHHPVRGRGRVRGGQAGAGPHRASGSLTEAASPVRMHLVLWMAATLWAFSGVLAGVLAPTVSMVTGH